MTAKLSSVERPSVTNGHELIDVVLVPGSNPADCAAATTMEAVVSSGSYGLQPDRLELTGELR
jgi:hypothetical protein